MSAGQSNLVGQEISITPGSHLPHGGMGEAGPGTTIKDAGNTKFRVADSTGLLVGSNYGPFSSGWQLVTFDWKATKTTTASFQLTTFLSAGQCISMISMFSMLRMKRILRLMPGPSLR
ncbi:gp24 [Klebsiella variicola]|uniref:Gp24 n=1 Tax=Klebsiella variicola TaxID=244366 RepID=A0A7H4MHN7_KLEVA|nr:gp24 [Klebsiella variicola]